MLNQKGFSLLVWKEFIEGLKKIQLSKRSQERIKLYKENVHQIYHLLEQPRPYLVIQSIIGGNRIQYIKQENQQLEVANKGVIIGRIYKVLNPQKSLDDDKNLSFKGSCFLATNYLAVCCSHQVIEDNKYIVRIDDRFLSVSKTIQLNVKKIYHNSFEKKQPGEQKSQDYAFLNIEMANWLKNVIHDNLARTTLTTIGEIEHSMFNFDATIYGYFQKIPKQFQGDEQWLGWKSSNLIKSSGVADYSKKELSYTVSTDFGFSGAPIVLQHEGKYHIVGIHTRGSHFHSKNFGILFNKPFFHYLQEVINELFNKEKGYDILQQKLNILSLASIVKYKRTFKDKLLTQPLLSLSFIEKALEKIIQKIASLEESELVLEQLRLQDIIISKEYQEDFVLDFSRLRLSQYVEKGSQVLNLKCISMLLLEIQTVRKKSLLPKSVEDKGQQQDPIIAIIEGCLLESYSYPLNIYYKKTKFLLDLINFVKKDFPTINQYYKYRESQSKIKQIGLDQRDKELYKIRQMTGFNLNQHMFRKKFMNLMKYSQERLSNSVIARVYLIKLCSFYNQLQKVITFFKEFAKDVDTVNQQLTGQTTVGTAYQFQTALEELLTLPTRQIFQSFTFHYKSLNFQEEDDLFKSIKIAYKEILKSQQISFSQDEIDHLAHYQYIFCRKYVKPFEQLLHQVILQSKEQNIRSNIRKLDQKVWQQKMQKVLKQKPHQLKKNELSQRPFNIYEAKIFQELFIDYEHTVFNKSLYKIIDMTQAEEQQYEEILNILVQIRDNNGLLKGTGFFLNIDTVCTTRHIFEGQDLSRFLIVNQRSRLQGKIISAKTSLDDNPLCSDIIFLKIDVRQYNFVGKENGPRKCHFSKKIYMLDNDIALDSKLFEGKNYFGLLIGFRKAQGSNQILPIKSYGQIQMNSKFHPLIGEHHLSGSPILLRIAKQQKDNEDIEYQYAIVGIYSGVQLGHHGCSTMQRYLSKCFNIPPNSIEFRRLSQCISQIRDQYKQFIVKIYSSLDHFLLRVMGQIMRLNSLNIYLEDLTMHNILFGTNLLTDIAFSSLPIRLHLQYLHPDHRIDGAFEKIKLQLEKEGKNIFSKFIKNLSGHVFEGCENFVQSSVLVNQLQMLEKSSNLVQYYTTYLEGKYYFDKENCTLQPYNSISQQKRPLKSTYLTQETKFEKIFKSGPAEHLARINLGYNLLKNNEDKIENTMSDNRKYLLCQKYLHDVEKLIKCAQQKITNQDFFYLAKKILQVAMKQAKSSLVIKNPTLEEDEIQQLKSFKEVFQSYIKYLTNFSNLDISMRNDFKHAQQNKVQKYYKLSKNWSFVSDILSLFYSFQV